MERQDQIISFIIQIIVLDAFLNLSAGGDVYKRQFMDSSGIGVILGRCRNLGFSGGRVKAVHLNSERVRKIFSMAGLYKLVIVEED